MYVCVVVVIMCCNTCVSVSVCVCGGCDYGVCAVIHV